jgi:hypothetical protein
MKLKIPQLPLQPAWRWPEKNAPTAVRMPLLRKTVATTVRRAGLLGLVGDAESCQHEQIHALADRCL